MLRKIGVASLDALTTSLDDFSTSTTPEIAAFDPAHTLNFFRGANLEATLDSEPVLLLQSLRVVPDDVWAAAAGEP